MPPHPVLRLLLYLLSSNANAPLDRIQRDSSGSPPNEKELAPYDEKNVIHNGGEKELAPYDQKHLVPGGEKEVRLGSIVAHGKHHDIAILNTEYEGKPTDEELEVLRRVPGSVPGVAYLLCAVEFCERASYYGITLYSCES